MRFYYCSHTLTREIAQNESVMLKSTYSHKNNNLI